MKDGTAKSNRVSAVKRKEAVDEMKPPTQATLNAKLNWTARQRQRSDSNK